MMMEAHQIASMPPQEFRQRFVAGELTELQQDEFQDNLSRAMRTATVANLLGTSRNQPTRRRRRTPSGGRTAAAPADRVSSPASSSSSSRRGSRGPQKSKVKVTVYYLPDTARVPKFTVVPTDPMIKSHMEQGYGKDLFYFATFFYFHHGLLNIRRPCFDMNPALK